MQQKCCSSMRESPSVRWARNQQLEGEPTLSVGLHKRSCFCRGCSMACGRDRDPIHQNPLQISSYQLPSVCLGQPFFPFDLNPRLTLNPLCLAEVQTHFTPTTPGTCSRLLPQYLSSTAFTAPVLCVD